MTSTLTAADVAPGTDLRDAFRAAYQNRYTWEPDFGGYQGRCVFEQGDRRISGSFVVGSDLKVQVDGVDDPEVEKAISSQLWEVTIHRVRRPFESVHGANTFTAGDRDAVGLEVIVGGKNEGDRYRIKDNVVTMVHRHIHGTVVTIFTKSITETGQGYLSHTYSSQYSDPKTGEPRGGTNYFEDTFVPLPIKGTEGSGQNSSEFWVLARRVIQTETPQGKSAQIFRFEDLRPLN
jgi:hypothetical protein